MDRIKRISKTILKKYRKNSKRYNIALGALLLLSIGLGIYLLVRIKPNDDIFFLNTNDRAVLGNKNPSFNVLFGEREDSTSQWVRFEARASSKNPFGIENEKFFTKLFRTVKPKKEYGIEMSLEGVGLSETELLDLGGQEEVVKSVADIIGTDEIETTTELIESGRIIGQYTEEPVSKQTVLNKGVAKGIDIEYQILEGLGVKEEIVLRSMEEYSGDCSEDLENCAVPLNRFVFDLKLDEGLELKKGWFTIDGESTESYYFIDSEGNYVAHFLPSWALDGVGNKTYDVDLIVEEDEDNYRVEVIVNAEWLFSAERVYPIRIDPSIVHDDKTDFDTGIFERTESFTGARVEIEQPKGGIIDTDTVGYWDMDSDSYNTLSATGGSTSTSGAYNVNTFTSSGTFTPSAAMRAEVLVVGGGGGAGASGTNTSRNGGGGAAGGLVLMEGYPVTATGKTVTVGGGGAGSAFGGTGGAEGSDSVFDTLTAKGGGGGGWASGTSNGHDGGSGGGAGYYDGAYTGGTGTQPTQSGDSGTYGYGSDGANTASTDAGGGGGAGGTASGSTGGIGMSVWSTTYAEGGNAGSDASSGAANSGDGGHAPAKNVGASGGSGGSGIVKVRYLPTSIDDDSGNSHDLGLAGTTSVDGLVGEARDFDGTDDYGLLSSGITALNTLTVSGWFKRDTDERKVLVGFSDFLPGETVASYVPILIVQDDGRIRGEYWTGTITGITSKTQVKVGEWTHIALVGDSTNQYLYINGVLEGSGSGTINNSFWTHTTIGTGYDTTQRGASSASWPYFDGTIDEVHISDVARTSGDIMREYLRGVPNIRGVHTSAELDLGGSSTISSLSWVENGVHTGDGETPYSTTGLVAQWNLNETSGTTAVSGGTCGTSCNGTLTGFDSTASQDADPDSSWTYNNRRWGAGAAMFDGVDSYIGCTDANCGTTSKLDFDASQSFSYGTWVQTSKKDTAQVILSKQSTYNASAGWSLWIFSDNKVYCNVHDGINNAWAQSSTLITDGEWHYIACNINRSTNEINLYVDGKYEGLAYISSVGSLDTTSDFRFGSQGSGGTYFQGNIDSTSVYSRVMSATEILSNYQAGNIEFQYRTSTDGSTWGDWVTSSSTEIDDLDNPYLYSTTESGLVSYWPMDETSGTGVEDLTGTYDGTATGTTIIDGKAGRARSFNGSGDQVAIGNYSIVDNLGDLTVEAWITTDSTDAAHHRVFTETNVLYVGQYGTQITFYAGDGTVWTNTSNIMGNIPVGEWTHVVWVKDGTAGRVYINGVLTGNMTMPSTLGTSINGNYFGSWGGGQYWDGDIDEVRIYNTVLGAGDIQNKYIEGISAFGTVKGSTDSIVKSDSGSNSQKITVGESRVDEYTKGYWKLDETGGSSAYIKDYSGNGNDGTPTDITYVNGKVGGAQSFNGSSSYINVGNNSSVNITGDLTLEAWIYPTALSNNAIVTWANGSSLYPFHLIVLSTGALRLNGNTFASTDSVGTIPMNEWTHVATTIEDTLVKIYINGTIDKIADVPGASGRTASDTYLTISRSGSQYFDGHLDEVRISNIARTSEEIKYAYNLGKDSYYNKNINIDTSSLVDADTEAYWTLDQASGSGAYLLDSSGNGNHATPSGAIYADGFVNGSRDFDGTNDVLTTSYSTSPGSGDITLSAWIKVDSGPTGERAIVSQRNTSWDSLYLVVDPQWGYLSFARDWSTAGGEWVTDDGAITTGVWHHVAVTYSGSAISNDPIFYVDGVVQSLQADTNPTGTVDSSTQTWTVGAKSNSTAFFPGLMDEVEISSTIRTQDEIQAAYNLGRSKDLTLKTKIPFWLASDTLGSNIEAIVGNSAYANYQPDANVVGHWRMDDPSVDSRIPTGVSNLQGYWDLTEPSGSGAYILDKSSNSNHGTPTGTSYVDGILGGARSFNGSSYITTTANAEVDYLYATSGNAWSTEFWFNTSGVTSNGVMLGRGGGVGTGATYGVYVTSAGALQTVIRGAYTTPATGVADGQWHHIVLTWDGTTGYAYFDNGSPTTLNIGTASQQNYNISIGAQANGSNTRFVGSVDEVGIYDRALSASEVSYRYNSILYKDIKDSSGLGNDGVSNDLPYTGGYLGGSRYFDGVDDYADLGMSTINTKLSGASQITMSAWMNPSTLPSARTRIISVYSADNASGAVLGFYGSALEVGGRSQAADSYQYSRYSISETNRWYHFAGVLDLANDKILIYLDGKLVKEESMTFGSSTYVPGTPTIPRDSLGGSASSATVTEMFNGYADEIRISKTLRSAEEIREEYEVGRRKFDIKVDFKADLQSGNLISGSGDTSFTISETSYGTTAAIENLNIGDRVIVMENYGGTEYRAQGIIDSVNTGTGAVTVSSWDTGSTFPTSGYTVNASVFKWQEEFLDIRGIMDEQKDSFSILTLRLPNSVGMNTWVDDISSQKDFVASDLSGGIAGDTSYIQYRPIFTTWDDNVTPYISSVQVDYAAAGPTMDQLMRHGKWFNGGTEQNFWWAR